MVVLMGKSSINGPSSMAMLNNQMVPVFELGRELNRDVILQILASDPVVYHDSSRSICILHLEIVIACFLGSPQSAQTQIWYCRWYISHPKFSFVLCPLFIYQKPDVRRLNPCSGRLDPIVDCWIHIFDVESVCLILKPCLLSVNRYLLLSPHFLWSDHVKSVLSGHPRYV